MATNDKDSSAAVTTEEGKQQTQVTREKTDEEFTEAENNKERADIQATNILRSGLTKQQKKETLFDLYERFWANGNESIHDYLIRFHKLINDMKINKMEILVHQRNTKFVNNLPLYWGKYVTIVKNSKDISIVSYVDLYTHLKSYEQHAMKTLSKMNQTSGNADPLAYMAQATQSTSSTSQYVPLPPYGFQKQFPPTNNQLRTSTNPITQATIQAGQITTESVQRRAPGNKGKHAATGSQGKVVTCYNCHGQGHVAKECKDKKQARDLQWFKDKALLMEAKEKGIILDAEAEAFLADVECTTPYAEPLAITTTTAFKVSHEDAYDSDVDEAPHAAAAFIANLMQTGPSTGQGTSNDIDFHSEVVTELLQSYGQPVQTVPMLSKRPTFSTKNLHKSALGHRNPLYLKSAELCRPTLYLGDVIVDPVHTPLRVYDSEKTLVQPEQLSREQVYWLPANEVASYNCNQSKPLDKEYDQCVIDKKSLEIENKNLLIQNECLLAESVSKDICSVMLTSDVVVPISVEPRSNCVEEHSKNLELKAEILKVCNNLSSPELNVFFEINKLKDQIQGKDELIKKLKAQIYNMKEVSADSNLKSNSNVSSRATVPEKPKVLAPGLYAMTLKYIPRKETISLVKKTNVCVNLSTRIKSVTEASKLKSKCENETHRNFAS
ncbi:retrovirus-related pol polyprotein from transposon TNT 1-94 [Tanacetum coccineum]